MNDESTTIRCSCCRKGVKCGTDDVSTVLLRMEEPLDAKGRLTSRAFSGWSFWEDGLIEGYWTAMCSSCTKLDQWFPDGG